MARILLIDDDQPLLDALAANLVNAGHEVTPAVDARRAVELFRQEPTDLVVTDIIMPGQEGIETIIALRAELPTLPIIAISGSAHNARFYLGMATKLGAQRTLAKPFTAAELLRVVDEVLAAAPPPVPMSAKTPPLAAGRPRRSA